MEEEEKKEMEWIHTQILLLKSGVLSFEEWLKVMFVWAKEQDAKRKDSEQ